MGWGEVVGWIGALVFIATCSMKTMVPLRTLGIVANVLFIVYGASMHVWPTLFVNSVLLPLNGWRLYQMLQLTRRVREASRGDLSMAWLKSFMARRGVREGEILFAKDAEAETLCFLVSGRFRLVESGRELGPGAVVGELGLIAPDNRRTQTLRAETAGEVLEIGYDEVRQLQFQNPSFSFYFLRLTTGRLFQNLAELERRLAEQEATGAPASAHRPEERA